MFEVHTSVFSVPLNAADPSLLARVAKFVAVGGACYLIQLGLLHLLSGSADLYLADVAAFLLSAQVNFLLSQSFTWGDRQSAERFGLRWIKYNANALVSVLVVNAAAVWTLARVGLPLWAALLSANIVTAVFTFVVNHHLVFRPSAASTDELEETTA